MAWTGRGKDEIYWDGLLIADKLRGDGSQITGITASADGKVKVDTAATSDFLGATSGAGTLRAVAPITYTDGGDFITLGLDQTSIDHVNLASIGTNTHTQIDTHIASGSIHFTEASIDHTAISNVGTNTHAQIDTSITNYNTTSGAYLAHAADSSDPHGSHLTQTNITSSGTISGATIVNTSDSTASGAEVVRNILIGTEATPAAASTYQQGTIYMQYTA